MSSAAQSKNPDWRLYLIVDDSLAPQGRSLEQIVRAAAVGGATMIQLRHKSENTRAFLDSAQSLRTVTRELGLPFIVNDRVDVALAVDADGVHLGPDDMPLALARHLLGAVKMIGASTGTLEEARQAVTDGADYLGVGAVFGTRSKADAGEPIGTKGLREIVCAVPIPVVGIGGVTADNVTEVIKVGAAGAAILSAIVCAPDVESAARILRQKIEGVVLVR